MRLNRWVFWASAAAVIVGGSATALASAGAASTPDATPVQTTIELDATPGVTFAPPPADAAPKLTVQQAVDVAAGKTGYQLPEGVSVALGLFTLPIGPDCGVSCEKGNTVVNGVAYSVYQQLAYGFMVNHCPAGSTLPDWKCQQWLFLDANTGQEIGQLIPPPDRSGSTPAG